MPPASHYHSRKPQMPIPVEAPTPPPQNPKDNQSTKRRFWLWTGIILILLILRWLPSHLHVKAPLVHSFRECVDYGYPVEEGTPARCIVPGQKTFTEEAKALASGEPKTNRDYQVLVDAKNGPATASTAIITTPDQWVAFWAKTHAHLPALPPLIEVDFAKSMVVADIEGTHADPYHVQITNISEVTREIQITVKRSMPGKNCIVEGPAVAPYYIVKLDKSAKPIVFVFEDNPGTTCATGEGSGGVSNY